jgi:ethanolamine utilization protein EutN
MLIVQPLTFELAPQGPHAIAIDLVRAGRGELVFFVRSREAANACADPFTPVDAACVGIVDDVGLLRASRPREELSAAAADPGALVWLLRPARGDT